MNYNKEIINRLAKEYNGKITAKILFLYTDMTLKEAQEELKKLTLGDRIKMEIDEDGNVVYVFPEFLEFESNPKYKRKEKGERKMNAGKLYNDFYRCCIKTKSPLLALILSFIFAGLGHFYVGNVNRAFGFLIGYGVAWIIGLGWIITIVAMIDSYRLAKNFHEYRYRKFEKTCY